MRNINFGYLVEVFVQKINQVALIKQLEAATNDQSELAENNVFGDLIEALINIDFDDVVCVLFEQSFGGKKVLEYLKELEVEDKSKQFFSEFLELIGICQTLREHSKGILLHEIKLVFHENLPNELKEQLIENGMLNESISHYFDISKYTRECIAERFTHVNVNAPGLMNICNQDYYIEQS